MSETVFQKVFREIDEWKAAGQPEPAPARVVFDHPDVKALVDPFRKIPRNVVIVPREGTPGKKHNFADLSYSRRAQISCVQKAVGEKMLLLTDGRVVEHTEGFEINDHAHTVIFPGERGVSQNLHASREDLDQLSDQELQAELDETLRLVGIRGVEAVILGRRLDILGSMADLLDDYMPNGIEKSLAEYTARVTLAT